MKLREPEQVLDPRAHPSVTLDGPDAMPAQSMAMFHYPSTAPTAGTAADLTELERLGLMQDQLAQQVSDLQTNMQRMAQDVHDLRKQLCAAIQHGTTIGVTR